MPLVKIEGMREVHMGSMQAEMVREEGGVRYVRSIEPLEPYATRLTDRLDCFARSTPETILFADRGPDGEWRRLTYAEARRQARAVAQAILDRGLSAERPILILSGNDIEHAILALGAMYAGVPYAPVSPAYSLLSRDHAKLKQVAELLEPGLVFAADGQRFASAIADIWRPGMELVVTRNPPDGMEATAFAALCETVPSEAVDRATDWVGPDTIAKFLFTSGSTGTPKAVINTQRMICCNQVMIHQALAFLKDEPPVMVDWLPWNHTAGGNHNFGIALYNGGTLYIDDGTPTPEGIEKTVRNLMEVAPTLYFNVPKGYEALCEHLPRNQRLRENLFSRVKLLQYAGAGLAQHVWDALEGYARQSVGERIMMITGYGSTETAPFAFTTTWPVDRPGEIGLPAAGMELKLVPAEEKTELRVRGPNVTPGYWKHDELTAAAFDEEGFYRIQDAVKLVDANDINKGFLFDGRMSEDFKLSTGTWVNLASVRGGLIAALAPHARDVVLAGHDEDFVTALVFPDPDACRALMEGDDGADLEALCADPGVLRYFSQKLAAHAATATGSSRRVERMVLLAEPASIDSGEMTDKGSINQRAVLKNRAGLVEDLYRADPPAHVILARKST
ncbi:feruloyl-CoA synthase [Afifella sp. IM 167]|uniref:feruloyl-CoA synthase n=1 Tax=Afifella sp. IM 167 TaxID=2033586 RepID=UPI001CCD85EB|nr:feruloyl-CoA synthase [Afifella sp. IM 167]MBZ8132149.1 feruloyl-CoA synthase [Afifella sp. IM 167]